MKFITLALLLAISGSVVAEGSEALETNPLTGSEIPTGEKAFVDSINNFSKAKILEQLGEPSKKDDVTLHGSDKVVASVWQYHYINTDADGAYYETTELDFVDDKVVTVVFMNNDGSDVENGVKMTPPAKPEL